MPTTISSSPRRALADALQNDRAGKVSARDAKKIVDAAVQDIAKARDPQAVFESNKAVIDAAKVLSTGSESATRALSRYATEGRNAVSVRLEQQTTPGRLPADAFRVLRESLEAVGGTGRISLSDVHGNARTGFSFRYTQDGKSGAGFAIKHNDAWLLSPVKLTGEDLEKATRLFKEYFNEYFVPDMREWGASNAEITAARRAVVPERAYFPGDSDPHGLTADYPVVLTFNNATGSDHGFFLGFNPETGEGEAYSFN